MHCVHVCHIIYYFDKVCNETCLSCYLLFFKMHCVHVCHIIHYFDKVCYEHACHVIYYFDKVCCELICHIIYYFDKVCYEQICHVIYDFIMFTISMTVLSLSTDILLLCRPKFWCLYNYVICVLGKALSTEVQRVMYHDSTALSASGLWTIFDRFQ